METVYTIRKPVDPNLSVDKVVDAKVRSILEQRLREYDGEAKRAFVNLDENPIWLNEEKGIAIKRVTIRGINKVQSLHGKKDKNGNLISEKMYYGTSGSIVLNYIDYFYDIDYPEKTNTASEENADTYIYTYYDDESNEGLRIDPVEHVYEVQRFHIRRSRSFKRT